MILKAKLTEIDNKKKSSQRDDLFYTNYEKAITYIL